MGNTLTHDSGKPPKGVMAWLATLGTTRVWLAALGYFLFYVGYAGLPKLFFTPHELQQKVSGWNLLPSAAFAAVITTIILFSVMRWWRHAQQREVMGIKVPFPGRWAILAGVAVAGIMLATPLLYTVPERSIAMMGLLSRGGVLLLAPVVDLMTRQSPKRYWWIAWFLALAAVFVATKGFNLDIPQTAMVTLSLYLFAYLVRFNVLGSQIKQGGWNTKRAFFIEEQMVAAPAFLLLTILIALFGPGDAGEGVRAGFKLFFTLGPGVAPALLTGVLGVFTGLFATLIFIDKRAFAFCVPLNRASGMLAQVVATTLLFLFFDGAVPKNPTLVGAGILMIALVFLATMNRQTSSPPSPQGAQGTVKPSDEAA